MRRFMMVAGTLVLAACTNPAAPRLMAGKYYLMGDKDCVRVSNFTPTRIRCFDKKGVFTGYRDAMNPGQLQMWQYQVASRAAESRSFDRSLEEGNRQLQAQTEQIRRLGDAYQAPMVQNPSIGTRQAPVVTYRQVGNALLGSNGVTYRKVGSSIVGSDGTTCQITSDQLICR